MGAENQTLTIEQEFAKAVKPLMDYLNYKHHPHVTVIVTSQNAELLEGAISYNYIPEKCDNIKSNG